MIRTLVAEQATELGADWSVDHERGNPPVVNDERCTAFAADALSSLFGDENVLSAEQSAGSEDFSWYLDHVPGSYIRLGVAASGEQFHDLHRSDFDVSEHAVHVGAAGLAAIATHFLGASP